MAQYDLPRKNNRMLQAPAIAMPPPTAVPSASVPGDPRGLTPFIREMAIKYGITPEVALKVARSEGLAQFYGDNGKSGGAFQLYTGGGLGNEFQKETGLSPLDEANEKATIEYALKRAAQGGWGPWYGAAKVGVGQWDGINSDAAAKAIASAKPPLDPTPNVGSGATDYETNVASTTTPVEDKKDEKKKSNWGEAAGEGLEAVGKAYAAGAKSTASSPANVPTPQMPIPQAPQPMIDAKRAEMQRQQLAIAMQRLNSGRLV